MILKTLPLLLSLALSGCAILELEDDVAAENSDLEHPSQSNDVNQSTKSTESLQSSLIFHNQFKNNAESINETNNETNIEIKHLSQDPPKHDINYYARGIMQDLIANLQYVNSTTPVAVTSFVMLDSNYNETNILGLQIAESMIHEVHKFGIPVIDFKTTGFIRVTEQGDFAFSKDYQDFTGELAARYIVTGTMLKNTEGYFINARIVGVKSQAVVASAQSFIPNAVAEPILKMSVLPKTAILNETVELGNVPPPLGNMANNSSSNRVSLVK
jgi:TolB-like protein